VPFGAACNVELEGGGTGTGRVGGALNCSRTSKEAGMSPTGRYTREEGEIPSRSSTSSSMVTFEGGI